MTCKTTTALGGRRIRAVALACAPVALAALLVGCTTGPTPTPTPSGPTELTVKYVITTNSPVHIYYGTPSSMRSADETQSWSVEQKAPSNQRISLTAASSDFANAKAEVTCEIVVNGKSMSTRKAMGAAATANCEVAPAALT